MSTLLVIANDPAAEELIRGNLGSLGYEIVIAPDAGAAIRSFFSIRPDVAVLDASLSDDLERLRQRISGIDADLPVVFLAAAGARWLPGTLPIQPDLDEVVVKPYTAKDVRQAIERAMAAGRHARPSVVLIGDLQLDGTTHELKGPDAQVQLTPTEFRLLSYLAQRQGMVTSSEDLLGRVWEFLPGTGSSELVRSHMRNLRDKIKIVAPGQELIQTLPRRGYRLI